MSLFDFVLLPILVGSYITKDTVDDMGSLSIRNRRLIRTQYGEPKDLDWDGDLYFWYNGLDKDEHWFATFCEGNLVKLELVPRDDVRTRLEKDSLVI
jgi:hypothetical protein